MKGLFGEQVKPFDKKRFSEDRAHAACPGSGPAFMTCKTCGHCVRPGGFYKCKLMERYWSHGGATDIHLKDWACSFYEKET